MRNSNSITIPIANDNIKKQVHSQAEDAVHKVLALYFQNELLPYLQIEGEIDHIGPTEITHLELKKYYQDFNYVMKDGSWAHLEFQSTDKGISDLKRFRSYEALTSQQYNVDVRTYVLYSGTIKNPKTEFTTGFNTYRVKPIIMKGHRAEEIFDNLTCKLENNLPIIKEDLVPLALCPLMGGNISQKERIRKAFQFVNKVSNIFSDIDKIEAVIYAMANKFLSETDMNDIKEEIKMTPLGTIIYNDGIRDGISQGILQGIEKESLLIAKKLFEKGLSFDFVRTSIENLTNEQLQEIFDEVMISKIK